MIKARTRPTTLVENPGMTSLTLAPETPQTPCPSWCDGTHYLAGEEAEAGVIHTAPQERARGWSIEALQCYEEPRPCLGLVFDGELVLDDLTVEEARGIGAALLRSAERISVTVEGA